MKQIIFRKFGPPALVAQCEQGEKPSEPSSWEVIVAVEAFSINPADLAMMLGQYGFLNQPPATVGMEAAGRIIEVGSGVRDLNVGDPVVILANNNWCQFRKVAATLVVKVPAQADLTQMAMLKVTGLTAWKLLSEIVNLKPGEYVLQNAPLSAVGQYVIQLANMLGFRTINLVRRPEEIAQVQQRGGPLCFTDSADVAQCIRQEIGKVPLRLALDSVGGQATDRLGQCMSENGVVVNYGMLSLEPCVFSPEHLIFRNVHLVGFWLSRVLNKMAAVDRNQQILQLANWVCEGSLVGSIDSVYPIDQITLALRRAEQAGRRGKVLVNPLLNQQA